MATRVRQGAKAVVKGTTKGWAASGVVDAAAVVAVRVDLRVEKGLSATCWLLPLPGQPFRVVERREDKPGSMQLTILGARRRG